MPPQQLTKNDRVRESVNILSKLKKLGIPEVDIGYRNTKVVLDKWIADGEATEAQVDFPRAGRIAHMFLPSTAGEKITYVLKATEQLKEELSQVPQDSQDQTMD